MDKNRTKYDTTKIREKVKAKGLTYTAFSQKISKKTKVPAKTVEAHLAGRNAPVNQEERDAWCKFVPTITQEELNKCFGVIGKKDKTAEVIKKKEQFNHQRLETAIKNSGMTKNKICKILNISSQSFINWRNRGTTPSDEILSRLAELLDINAEDLFDVVTEEVVEKPKAEPKEKDGFVLNKGFKKIDTQNIHDIFEIINSNILLLADNMSKATLISDAKIAKLEEELQEIKKIASEKTVIALKKAPVEEEKKEEAKSGAVDKAIAKIKEKEVENVQPQKLLVAYNKDDTFQMYREKINRMVSIIANKNNDTYKQTMHKFYEEMNRVYGVVYSQLEKEFKDKYHRKHTGTVELIYESEMYRQLLYNMVATKLSRMI